MAFPVNPSSSAATLTATEEFFLVAGGRYVATAGLESGTLGTATLQYQDAAGAWVDYTNSGGELPYHGIINIPQSGYVRWAIAGGSSPVISVDFVQQRTDQLNGDPTDVGGVGADGTGINSDAQAEQFRDALGVLPKRPYASTPIAALVNFRKRLERAEDAACGFISDSTMTPAGSVPSTFASWLAARYPTHRVELRQAANNMQSITKTVVQAGPSGRRRRYFPTGTTWTPQMATSYLRTSIDAATRVSYEAEVAFDAGSLNGSGWPTVNIQMMGHSAGADSSYLMLTNAGELYMTWLNSGGTAVGGPPSNVKVPAMTAGVPVRYRADLVVDNGGGARTINYYRSVDEGANWIAVGTQVSGAVTSYKAPAAGFPFWLNCSPGATPTLNGVSIYHAQVLIGTTRDPVLPERIDLWVHVTGMTTNASTLVGSPTIYVNQAAQIGATLETNGFFNGAGAGDFATEAYRCWVDHAPTFVQINSSHNDNVLWGADWGTQMDAAVVVVLARHGTLKPLILHTTQNPQAFNDSGELSDQHNRRQAEILQYAARNNRGCTDIYQAFLDAANAAYLEGAGDVHPTYLGYLFWTSVFEDCFLSGTNEPPLVAE